MGDRALVTIHAEPHIEWQRDGAARFVAGLKALGVPCEATSDRCRHDGFPVLLGTTCWRDLEHGEYLLVDRCSFGDTNRQVSLVRDGHGRRGDHRVPLNPCASRWERHGVPVQPWQRGERTVLCGQHQSWSPQWPVLADWYASVKATHFRRHPAGDNPTGLIETRDWNACGLAVTLNSSVGVAAVLAGVPTQVHDFAGMAWPGFAYGSDREPWLHWLAHTQWTWDEIAEGRPWAHIL